MSLSFGSLELARRQADVVLTGNESWKHETLARVCFTIFVNLSENVCVCACVLLLLFFFKHSFLFHFTSFWRKVATKLKTETVGHVNTIPHMLTSNVVIEFVQQTDAIRWHTTCLWLFQTLLLCIRWLRPICLSSKVLTGTIESGSNIDMVWIEKLEAISFCEFPPLSP